MASGIVRPDQPAAPPRGAGRGLALVVGAALVLAVALTGCGSPVPTRTELVSSLERSGMSGDEAECAADAVLTNMSDAQVALLVERGPGGAPVDDPDSSDDAADKVRAALGKCRADAEASTSTTTSTTTTTTHPN